MRLEVLRKPKCFVQYKDITSGGGGGGREICQIFQSPPAGGIKTGEEKGSYIEQLAEAKAWADTLTVQYVLCTVYCKSR